MLRPTDNSSFSFYVYGNSIARYHNESKVLEVRNHFTDQWNQVDNPDVWRRIQVDGEKVSKGDAEKVYNTFHTKLKKDHQITD